MIFCYSRVLIFYKYILGLFGQQDWQSDQAEMQHLRNIEAMKSLEYLHS